MALLLTMAAGAAGSAAYNTAKSVGKAGKRARAKRKAKPLSLQHKLAISLGLKRKKKGLKGRLVGRTTTGKVVRGAGLLAAGGLAGLALAKKKAGAGSLIGKAGSQLTVEDLSPKNPWSSNSTSLVKGPVDKTVARASRVFGRGAGLSTAAATIGYAEGIGAAAIDVGKSYIPLAKKGAGAVIEQGRASRRFVDAQIQSGLERDKAARQNFFATRWEKDRAARTKAANKLISVRQRFLGFSDNPAILEFSNLGHSPLAEFRKTRRRGRKLSAAHKRKISAALKNRNRSRQSNNGFDEDRLLKRARTIQTLAGSWERSTQGLENIGRAFQVVNDSTTRRRLARRQLGLGELNRTSRTIAIAGDVIGRRLLR